MALTVWGLYGRKYGRTYGETKDREVIQKDFTPRCLRAFTLAGHSTVTGSAFFPIVPSPKALVVDYTKDGQRKTLEVPLDKLKGLHVRPEAEQKSLCSAARTCPS